MSPGPMPRGYRAPHADPMHDGQMCSKCGKPNGKIYTPAISGVPYWCKCPGSTTELVVPHESLQVPSDESKFDPNYTVSSVHPVDFIPERLPLLVRPKVIVLCGSSRFIDIMAVMGWLLEKHEGAIVMGLHLLPKWYCPDIPDHIAEAEGVSEQMDELHLRKIDMSDEIFVINPGYYIGASTTREIEYALYTRKIPVRWLTDDPMTEFIRAHLSNLERREKGELHG